MQSHYRSYAVARVAYDLPAAAWYFPSPALANNGGPTQTRALLSGSPAINAGDSATCTPTDQRGYIRIMPCDIGTYEVGASVVVNQQPQCERQPEVRASGERQRHSDDHCDRARRRRDEQRRGGYARAHLHSSDQCGERRAELHGRAEPDGELERRGADGNALDERLHPRPER